MRQQFHEDADQSNFAWPQTTLTCVNRRNQLNNPNSIYSKIGEISLRYSHDSQTYVIDGRSKAKDTKSSARNAIRSHYRWVRQDIVLPLNNTEQDKDENITVRSEREYNAKWNHTRRKKLLKFAAERRTQMRKQVLSAAMPSYAKMDTFKPDPTINHRQTNLLYEAASDKSVISIEYSEKENVTWDIDNSTRTSESSSPPPPPPPPPPQQPQVHHSYSDESSLTDDSPSCITTDISLYKGRDVKHFGRVEKISTNCVIKTNQSKKRTVTWWDDSKNRHKPFLLKTDASMEDDSLSPGLMGRCNISLPSYADIWGADNDIIDASSCTSQTSKHFTGEFWMDKTEKIKIQGVRVRKRVDAAIEKMKVMTVDLSEFVGEVNCAPESCGVNKKKMSEYMNANEVFCRGNKEESSSNLPIREVLVRIRSREDLILKKAREKQI
ncbi:hypothetical protein ACHAXM_008838 [Skeletonema potamos]|jgi:hypothetical protein